MSILLAFAVESAGERWTEGRRREALLDALESDMALAGTEVERVLRGHSAGRDASSTILALSSGSPSRSDLVAFVDSLLTVVIQSPTYDAPSGALDALLGSGDLQLLDDAELMVDLTSFPALVADLDREQGLLVAVVIELINYLEGEGIDTSHLNVGTPVPWEIRPTAAFTLLVDPGLRGALNGIYFRYRNTSIDLESISQAIDRIQGRLAARRRS